MKTAANKPAHGTEEWAIARAQGMSTQYIYDQIAAYQIGTRWHFADTDYISERGLLPVVTFSHGALIEDRRPTA